MGVNLLTTRCRQEEISHSPLPEAVAKSFLSLSRAVESAAREKKVVDLQALWGSRLTDAISENLPAEPVIVVLASHREAVITDGQDLAGAFDGIWFPSADDLLIFSTSTQLMVTVSHEEVLTSIEW